METSPYGMETRPYDMEISPYDMEMKPYDMEQKFRGQAKIKFPGFIFELTKDYPGIILKVTMDIFMAHFCLTGN